jgi:SPP1 family predicted phage head-tail adaptor
MALKCGDYSASDLTTPVRFERRVRTPDGAGGWAEAWQTIRTTRAYMKGLSGYERFTSDRLNAETKDRAVIRYYADLRPADRLVTDGKAYNITYIDDVERKHRWMVLDLAGGVAT